MLKYLNRLKQVIAIHKKENRICYFSISLNVSYNLQLQPDKVLSNVRNPINT